MYTRKVWGRWSGIDLEEGRDGEGEGEGEGEEEEEGVGVEVEVDSEVFRLFSPRSSSSSSGPSLFFDKKRETFSLFSPSSLFFFPRNHSDSPAGVETRRGRRLRV